MIKTILSTILTVSIVTVPQLQQANAATTPLESGSEFLEKFEISPMVLPITLIATQDQEITDSVQMGEEQASKPIRFTGSEDILIDVPKVEEQLKAAGVDIDLEGYTGQVIVYNSNDKSPWKNYVVTLKNAQGVPMYLAGLNMDSDLQLIDAEKAATDTHKIKKNKKVTQKRTISNLQFWTVDELAEKGVILNVYKDKLTAALKVSITDQEGNSVSTLNFTNQLNSNPGLVDTLNIKAEVYYVKNVPFSYEGSTKKVDLTLETENLNFSLSKGETEIQHMHFVVGSFGIDKVVFNDAAAAALKKAQEK